MKSIRYTSTTSLFGLPLVAVASGPSLDREERFGHARGIIAVALGAFACGGLALGAVAIGGLAVGLIAVGGVAVGSLEAAGGLTNASPAL